MPNTKLLMLMAGWCGEVTLDRISFTSRLVLAMILLENIGKLPERRKHIEKFLENN